MLRDIMTECRLGYSGQRRFMCVLSMMRYVGLPWDWECVASLRVLGHDLGAWMVPVHGGWGLFFSEGRPYGL